jgi:hypothetical protein
VSEKTKKGYSPGENGVPYEQTDQENHATSIHCQLLNPVEEDEVEKLIGDPAWWMSEKLDGRRQFIRKQGDTITGIDRFGLTGALPPAARRCCQELLQGLHPGWRGEVRRSRTAVPFCHERVKACEYRPGIGGGSGD